METISVIEAVRRATDPFGMGGMSTAAMRPSDTCPVHEYAVRLPDTTSWPTYESISESEQRVLDGNR